MVVTVKTGCNPYSTMVSLLNGQLVKHKRLPRCGSARIIPSISGRTHPLDSLGPQVASPPGIPRYPLSPDRHVYGSQQTSNHLTASTLDIGAHSTGSL